jgi:hypothetical protein
VGVVLTMMIVYKPWETFAFVPFLSGPTLIFTSSIEVTRKVTATRAPFDKNKSSVQGLRCVSAPTALPAELTQK